MLDAKRELRQNRIKFYFVSSAKHIIETEGLHAVTTRKVSELAGYNSGTLYNYFDDLDHVIFLACMEYMDEYNKEVIARVKNVTDPLELFLTTGGCFSEYSTQRPQIFWRLFYGCSEVCRQEYIAEYYELFHSTRDEPYEQLTKAKLVKTLNERNIIFLSGCLEQGYLTLENANKYSELNVMITKYFLEMVINGTLPAEEAHNQVIYYIRHTLKSYLEPQFQHLL